MNFTYAIICLVIGLILVTIIDTLGAISSRKLNFNYAYLSVCSFAVYIALGYMLSKQYSVQIALLIASLVGLYDGTVGLKLSIMLKANNKLNAQENIDILNLKTAITMVGIACLFVFVGYKLATLN